MSSEFSATILSAIAAAVSAVAAIYAIKQSILQRRLSYKPQIYLDDFLDLFYAPNQPVFDETINGRTGFDHLDVTVINIGNGSAQNIRYKWDYDFNNALNEITNLSEHLTNQSKTLTNNKFSYSVSKVGIDANININNKTNKAKMEYSLKYLLPQHLLETNSNKEIFELPMLITCVLYNQINFRILSGENIKYFKGPRLILSYQDSGGAAITEQFESEFILQSQEKNRQQTKQHVRIKFTKLDSGWIGKLLQRSRKIHAAKHVDKEINYFSEL